NFNCNDDYSTNAIHPNVKLILKTLATQNHKNRTCFLNLPEVCKVTGRIAIKVIHIRRKFTPIVRFAPTKFQMENLHLVRRYKPIKLNMEHLQLNFLNEKLDR